METFTQSPDSEISFSSVLNLFILRGNPFREPDQSRMLLKKIRQHLQDGQPLNFYIRIPEIDRMGRVFFLRVGKLIQRFERKGQITVNWSSLDGNEETIRKGLELMSLTTDNRIARMVNV